jgi:hypothetical protein
MPPPPPMGPGIPIKPHFEEHGNDRPMGMMGNELPDEWEYNNPGALQQKIEMMKRLMLQVGAVWAQPQATRQAAAATVRGWRNGCDSD